MTALRSRPGGMTVALGLFVAALWAGPTAAQGAQQFLNQLVGDWRGTGFIVRRPDGEQETAVCRLQTTRSGSGIRNSGRCAASSAGGNVEGALRYDAGRNLVVGSFLDPEANVRRPAAGSVVGGVLTLRRTENRGAERVRITARLERQTADRYRVDVTETAGRTRRTVLRLTFMRR